MTFYAPQNLEDLNKLKNLINQKTDIKKQRLNRKIQKATLNYGPAEQYAPITQLQAKHKRSVKRITLFETQTKMLEEATTPAIKSPTLEAIEPDENDEEENGQMRAINADISDMIFLPFDSKLFSPTNEFFKRRL